MEGEKPNRATNPSTSDSDRSVLNLEDMITTLGRTFASAPGFMWTDTGFEVLHADWPAYPRGRGIAITLSVLAEYPRGTQFFPIDDIDQCTLFVVGERPKRDLYGSQHLHVAVWNTDLRACASAGYIEGIHEREQLLDFPNGSIELTQKGLRSATINALLGPMADSLDKTILGHLYEDRFDTAVRELSLRVEAALRRASKLPDYGRRLVEKCFGESGVLVPQGLTNPSRQTLRNAFNGYFKYVRNEYAHSLPPVDLLTASMLVRRSIALLAVIEVVDRERKHGG